MKGSAALEIAGLEKSFGGVRAIADFSLRLEAGSIHGLIGPNGAGKTTVFNVITGIYAPSRGSVSFLGRDITGLGPHVIAAGGIGRTFQNIRLFGNLGVLKNIVIAGSSAQKYSLLDAALRLPAFRRAERELRERAVSLLEAVGLGDKQDDKAGGLPYGHQRRLEIARALALAPRLLLLDEPAAGMNAAESLELVRFIRAIRERFDLSILMIEHHMDVVTELCDEVTVLNFGRIIAGGKVGELKRDPRVIAAYLGSAPEGGHA
ncbi:MAG: ABC transporter ATP-binding protein [Spirochaetaceae bacterium]|nr:ABC transporter ATP-binding protein [Spirochaetaceae bacterium]